MVSRRWWWMTGAVVVIAACADDGSIVVDGGGGPPGGIELIGVSGRRLVDDDVYHVPLDYDDVAVARGGMRREAFVVRNTTARRATIVSLAIRGQGPGDEWLVLAPTRARIVALDARGIVLPPGGRLDFDVGFAPRVEGERAATLELIVWSDDRTDIRMIALHGRCARAPPG